MHTVTIVVCFMWAMDAIIFINYIVRIVLITHRICYHEIYITIYFTITIIAFNLMMLIIVFICINVNIIIVLQTI